MARDHEVWRLSGPQQLGPAVLREALFIHLCDLRGRIGDWQGALLALDCAQSQCLPSLHLINGAVAGSRLLLYLLAAVEPRLPKVIDADGLRPLQNSESTLLPR